MSDAPQPQMDPLSTLLRWYLDAGVGEATDARPRDRLTAAADSGPVNEPPLREDIHRTVPPERVQDVNAGPDREAPAPDWLSAAQRSASSAASLTALREALMAFEGCPLKRTATNLVFADGAPGADLLFIGEAPGREEDLKGLPFVGRSGQLLDRMLAAIGRDRSSVYIINVLPWRPPANRTPTPEEMAMCLPFLLRHIELAAPKVIVTLGGVASKQLLDTQTGIMRLRGSWQHLTLPSSRQIPVLPTFHPAYLLRQPAHKALAWRDFQAVRKRLHAETAGTAS